MDRDRRVDPHGDDVDGIEPRADDRFVTERTADGHSSTTRILIAAVGSRIPVDAAPVHEARNGCSCGGIGVARAIADRGVQLGRFHGVSAEIPLNKFDLFHVGFSCIIKIP